MTTPLSHERWPKRALGTARKPDSSKFIAANINAKAVTAKGAPFQFALKQVHRGRADEVCHIFIARLRIDRFRRVALFDHPTAHVRNTVGQRQRRRGWTTRSTATCGY